MSGDPLLDEMYDMAHSQNGFEFCEKYQHWMPATALEVMQKGGTLVQVAATLGVTMPTLCNWKNAKSPWYKPQFADAIEQGQMLAQAWWEEQGGKGIWGGKSFNGTTYIFIMKTRFRHHYGDHIAASNDGGEPMDVTLEALNAPADEAWDDWQEETDGPESEIGDPA